MCLALSSDLRGRLFCNFWSIATEPTMFVLVTYDVSTTSKAGSRRLRRVARACKDYGLHVQKSVFECKVERKDWLVFKDRLLSEINQVEDPLRFYFLDAGVVVEHHGIKEPVDLEAPLVL